MKFVKRKPTPEDLIAKHEEAAARQKEKLQKQGSAADPLPDAATSAASPQR